MQDWSTFRWSCSLQRATLALQTKPAQKPQRTTQPTSDLMIALAKLTLQHEQERQNRARSENVVLQASASHPTTQRSHGRDVRSRRENCESQPGGLVRWTHPREATGCSLSRISSKVGSKCAGESAGRRATPTDGRDRRSSSEAGAQGGRTGSAEQRLEGSSLLQSQVQGRSRAGHRSVDLRSFSTATTKRTCGLFAKPRHWNLYRFTYWKTLLPEPRRPSRCNSWPLGLHPPAPKTRGKSANARARPGDEGEEED